MDDDRALQRRLATYRPVLERAMASRPLRPAHVQSRRARYVTSAAAAAIVAAGVVGWVGLRSSDDPASSGGAATNTTDDAVLEVTETSQDPLAIASPECITLTATSATTLPGSVTSGGGPICVATNGQVVDPTACSPSAIW